MVASLYYSFTNYSMGGNEKWVGLKNYIDIFTRDSTFFKSVRATLIFVIAAVPLKLAFALLVAAMLKQNRKGIGFFRTAYYLPSVLSGSIATSILWRALFRKNGYIDQLFLLVGLKPIGWFATPDMALLNISLLTAWQFGSSMVLFRECECAVFQWMHRRRPHQYAALYASNPGQTGAGGRAACNGGKAQWRLCPDSSSAK